MDLKIILFTGNSPILPTLKALLQALPPHKIELYCLCNDEIEAAQVHKECETIQKRKSADVCKVFMRGDFESATELSNHLFLKKETASGYLLFLASDVLPEKEALEQMLDCIAADDQVAGVNPVLYADWLSETEKRIAYMGMTFDYQKKLHYLYEGIQAENHLVRKARFFQIAHPGCLLLRLADFRAAGGFRSELGFLAFPLFCFKLLELRPKGYACVPEAKGYLKDKFDSWSFCGAWDSILQRGRLETGGVHADYASFCHEDGIGYGIDSWLTEGPGEIPDLANELTVRRWQEWRYHPKPTTLISFLSSLPVEERPYGIELARNRPASLPQTMQYYRVQADKIQALDKEGNSPLAEQIDQWQTKIRRFHYGELKPGIDLLQRTGLYNCGLDICPAIFDAWVEIAEKFEKLEISESWPEIAVVMPVWNPRPDFLSQAIESVLKQTYPNWQLCIADDASTKDGIRPLLESWAREDRRIKVKFREENGHICRATNTAIEMVTAPFTAFFDHDDLLSTHALGEVARTISQKPDLGFIYSDEDKINEDNVRRSPVFRPDFDCDLLYTGHLSTYATALIRQLGGLRIGTEGSQDLDFLLRSTELLDPGHIAHIPQILYHWRVHVESTASSFLAKPYVLEAWRRVYLDAAARQGRKAEWGEKRVHRQFRLLRFPAQRCLCSVILIIDHILPSRRLLDTVKELGTYVDVEVYALPLREDSPKTEAFPSLAYKSGNIAHACNEAASRVHSDVALFLSASLEPDSDCRLEQLVEFALAPHIDMASGNIWCKGRLASGGWYPDATGLPFLLLQGMGKEAVKNSVWGQMHLPRHVLGAPWECMAVKKEIFQAGGFLAEEYGSLATVAFALNAMRRNRFVAMNPWVNWQARAMPDPPDEIEMRFLFERRGEEIATCGLRNSNLRAAPDKDWTLVF